MASSTHTLSAGVVSKMLGMLGTQARLHAQQERFTRRPRSPFVAEICEEVLSDSAQFRGSIHTGAASAQAKRIILELGRQHSADAAYEAFQWFKAKAGGKALASWYHACISACVWNGRLDKGMALYSESTAAGHKCTLHVFNILIAGCGKIGALDSAIELLSNMEEQGLEPNSFSYMLFFEACNYKGSGKCDVALALFSRMLKKGVEVPDVAKAKMVTVVSTAIRTAGSVNDAVKAFVGLQHVGLERETEVYNCLLQTVARDKDWEQVLQAFRQMLDASVPTDSHTYSILLGSCIKGNKIAEAFQIFEWMVAGCGEKDSIANSPDTLKHLFQGCHQAGALEKALEVLAWMRSGCAKPTAGMIAQTEAMIDLTQLWDKRVFEKTSGKVMLSPHSKASNTAADSIVQVVLPGGLRPAPYDGKRSSYLSRPQEQFEVRFS